MSKDEKRSFINKLKKGDHQAYKELYNMYGNELIKYIRSYFPFDQTTAEDVFQEVFITVFSRIDSLKDVDKIRSWLYQIASRKSIDFIRKKKVEKKYMKQYGEQMEMLKMTSIDDQVISRDLFKILNNEVSHLPEFLRKVYILREYQNMPFKEIAEITKTSLSRVKKAMKKAVLKLLIQLKKKKIDKDVLY